MFQVANGLGMIMSVGCLLMVIVGLGSLAAWYVTYRDDLR
jgi:hypothetical protein